MSKKVLILVFLIVAFVMANVFATESRMTAMGGMNGYVKDNTDIFTYPGTIFNYNKFVTMEMRTGGDTADWSLGANLPLGEHILGVYLNEPTGIDVSDYFGETSLNLSKKIDIFYGLSDGLAVGLGLSGDYYSNNKDVETFGATYIDLKAGMSTDKLDTGIIIKLPMGKDDNKADDEKATFMNIGIDLNGRLYLIQKDNWSLAGIGELGFESSTTKFTPGSSKNTDSMINLNLGLGINYDVTDNTLLQLESDQLVWRWKRSNILPEVIRSHPTI